jgi:hypothetical protein
MASSARAVRLVLSDSLDDQGLGSPWIGPLLALGTRAKRYSRRLVGRQLIIAISVPQRDFAAALIGCGWVLASDAPLLAEPLETLRSLAPGTPLRAVNNGYVVTGYFSSLNESAVPPRVLFAGSGWRVDGIRALAKLAELEQPERTARPEAGSMEHMAGLDVDWDARLAKPAADLAIVGTMAWLKEDFRAYLAREGDDRSPSTLGSLLMPKVGRVATWFTRVLASATLAEQLPLPQDIGAVIFDGNGAVKYVGDIETPIAICVLDRSVADETTAEMLMQLRNTRGEPVAMTELGWRPPTGVEALAFSVAL